MSTHTEALRVRWSEVDAQGIVFNGQYLNYLDVATTGYWRALAMPYPMALSAFDADVVMRSCALDFRAPARFDEWLSVSVGLQSLGRTSLTLQARVHRGDTLLLQAEMRYVVVDRHRLTATPVPPALRLAMEAFEAGEPMLQVKVGAWQDLGVDAQPIRQQVFVAEQGIPADLEWDGADPDAVHAVAYNRLGQALGTGRWLEHVPGTAKVGRMAVAPAVRGTGVGAQVLEALIHSARQQGYRQVLLHAQASAVGFYRRAGFAVRGPAFEEAGIAHQEMVRAL
ncbi:MAG: YbgC/FadM family acyl-CoA thioesterase [Inhella sp.]|jgi:YbgC/YbaW family acyl-CoA thioester hydrolase|uniref:YbgC/FadM family acyl-CoA thioesterase n=1 Tax=Inhella sp. TaxID=1921806 RepID=UPI0022C4DD55|nr:YbgC/FadM family acyl-CoA thioesterase [Inhella sp.]MCZ8236044.1 YbgC/FadM family acyl-CoA thioesterase [Inhella sp.]